MKVELKNIKVNEAFSEETTCFTADIFVNGKKVAYAKNDGRGGCTFYYPYENCREIIKNVEAYYRTLPPVVEHHEQFGILKYNSSLESTIDDLLEKHLKKLADKKMENNFKKQICVGIPNGYSYRTFSYKGKKLSEVSKAVLQRDLYIIKSKLKEGEVILNTNLKELGVII